MKTPMKLSRTVNGNTDRNNTRVELNVEPVNSTYKTYKSRADTVQQGKMTELAETLTKCRRLNAQLVTKCLEIEGLRLPPREREEQRRVFLVLLKELHETCQSTQGFDDPDNSAAAFAVSSFGDWISRVIKDDTAQL